MAQTARRTAGGGGDDGDDADCRRVRGTPGPPTQQTDGDITEGKCWDGEPPQHGEDHQGRAVLLGDGGNKARASTDCGPAQERSVFLGLLLAGRPGDQPDAGEKRAPQRRRRVLIFVKVNPGKRGWGSSMAQMRMLKPLWISGVTAT